MSSKEEWLLIGTLVAPQGLKGEIRIKPSSEFPERFTKPGERWIQKKDDVAPKKFKLIEGRKIPGKSLFVIRLEEVHTRGHAEELIGGSMLVASNDRPQLGPNEYHYLDLIGLDAKLEASGPSIGKVTDLQNAGNDLIEIELLEGRRILIPFVKPIVPEVEIEAGWIRLNPPPGLLDL